MADETTPRQSPPPDREGRHAASGPGVPRMGSVRADLLARMGHELRTPLNAIIGFVRLVEDGLYATEAEKRDYLASARQSAMGLLDLINNILDLARMESGRFSLESVDLSVRELAEEVVRTLAPEAHAKGVEIEALVDPDVPHWLKSDPMRLRQVLYNLAGNAVKFTSQGLVTLTVEPDPAPCPQTTAEAERCALRFSVRDTGMGVPDEIRPELFESFVQKQSGDTVTGSGVGLGLSIARQIVEQMGGTIEFTSAEGSGSTFWFSVALQRGRSYGVPAANPDEALAGRGALVLNPDEATRRIYMARLAALGLQPQEAAAPDEARTCLQAAMDAGQPIPLVLVDHHLPRDDMLVFARSVRAHDNWYQPVLASLAPTGAVPDVAALREAGYSLFLTKPVMPDLLRHTLAERIRGLGQSGETPAPIQPANGRKRDGTGAGSRQVLVAEDNVVNQKLILALLSKDGYATRIVSNGQEAVEALRDRGYDLVLMDVQMPVMDGLTATRAIRQMPGGKAVPIIAMTADGLDGDRERCLRVGMDDYVPKPIMPDLLHEKLRHWLRAADQTPTEVDDAAEAPLLDQAHLDAVHAHAHAHDPRRFNGWVALFRSEARAALGVLGDPALREDPATVRAAARHLAQASAGFGAPRLRQLAERLADRLAEQPEAPCESLVQQLETTFRGVEAALAERFEAPDEATEQ